MGDSSKQTGFYIKAIVVFFGVIALVALAGLVEMQPQVESGFVPAQVYDGGTPTTTMATTTTVVTTTTLWTDACGCSDCGICCDLNHNSVIDETETETFIHNCGGDSDNERHMAAYYSLGNLCSCDEFMSKIWN